MRKISRLEHADRDFWKSAAERHLVAILEADVAAHSGLMGANEEGTLTHN